MDVIVRSTAMKIHAVNGERIVKMFWGSQVGWATALSLPNIFLTHSPGSRQSCGISPIFRPFHGIFVNIDNTLMFMANVTDADVTLTHSQPNVIRNYVSANMF